MTGGSGVALNLPGVSLTGYSTATDAAPSQHLVYGRALGPSSLLRSLLGNRLQVTMAFGCPNRAGSSVNNLPNSQLAQQGGKGREGCWRHSEISNKLDLLHQSPFPTLPSPWPVKSLSSLALSSIAFFQNSLFITQTLAFVTSFAAVYPEMAKLRMDPG